MTDLVVIILNNILHNIYNILRPYIINKSKSTSGENYN